MGHVEGCGIGREGKEKEGCLGRVGERERERPAEGLRRGSSGQRKKEKKMMARFCCIYIFIHTLPVGKKGVHFVLLHITHI
jgi:hypothetical protein